MPGTRGVNETELTPFSCAVKEYTGLSGRRTSRQQTTPSSDPVSTFRGRVGSYPGAGGGEELFWFGYVILPSICTWGLVLLLYERFFFHFFSSIVRECVYIRGFWCNRGVLGYTFFCLFFSWLRDTCLLLYVRLRRCVCLVFSVFGCARGYTHFWCNNTYPGTIHTRYIYI